MLCKIFHNSVHSNLAFIVDKASQITDNIFICIILILQDKNKSEKNVHCSLNKLKWIREIVQPETVRFRGLQYMERQYMCLQIVPWPQEHRPRAGVEPQWHLEHLGVAKQHQYRVKSVWVQLEVIRVSLILDDF